MLKYEKNKQKKKQLGIEYDLRLFLFYVYLTNIYLTFIPDS